MKKVFIGAGHGGTDSGAVGNGGNNIEQMQHAKEELQDHLINL